MAEFVIFLWYDMTLAGSYPGFFFVGVGYKNDFLKGFAKELLGGGYKKALKTNQTFFYIHFCYCFSRTNTSGKRSETSSPPPLYTALDTCWL